ncbi:MAG: hypothetical protein ACOYM3_20400 [Terrimicrobiaceae bacterium]
MTAAYGHGNAPRKLLGPLFEMVSGQGRSTWSIAMAFLHPLASIFLWVGGIARPSKPV